MICLICLAPCLSRASSSLHDEGIQAFNEGRYSVALTKLKEATRASHDDTAAIFLSLTKAAMGNCPEALPGLTHKADGASSTVRRLAALAAVKCYSSTGETSNAFSLLDKLERAFPDDPDVLYLAAKLHMKSFNDATFAMFQKAPSSYRVHQLSAEIFDTQARYSDAIAEYRKAIDLNSTAPDLHYRLGRALLAESHSPEALRNGAEQFEAELKLSPEDSASEFQLGQIARVQGDVAKAQSHLEHAVALSPTFTSAMIALGKIYSEKKEYGRAIPLLTRATELQPANETAHYALLTAYRNGGQPEKAKAEKETLDRLKKPAGGEFSDFLKKLGEKPTAQ
ncbi:MAG: tetratricopeptide repeat protein [Acidobacteriota bacterium]|nr:tetratricopeptide repeat protein [Acidobacteriota bacterium]